MNFSDASAITRPSVLILKFSKENPFGFKYTAETSPIVPLPDRVPAADLRCVVGYITLGCRLVLGGLPVNATGVSGL